LPYLTGRCEFYGLHLDINRHVLIPRPETETLVDLALNHIIQLRSHSGSDSSDGDDIPNTLLADVCTGSGCIALALAIHAPECHIYALDLSPDALAVASRNARRHGVAGRVSFMQSDLLSALDEPVDLIVSNPPYVALDEWSSLPHGVREFEPRLGLYGGRDGLDLIRRLLDQSARYLRPGGAVFLEIGARQGVAAQSLAHQAFPTARITIHLDLAGRERVLCIRT
jgi:release factor glutamine methyltransferase